jgi:hypothetical protein
MRQIGVYQRDDESQSMRCIFIATDKQTEGQIASLVQESRDANIQISPPDLHIFLLRRYVVNWGFYLEDLAGRIRHQVNILDLMRNFFPQIAFYLTRSRLTK